MKPISRGESLQLQPLPKMERKKPLYRFELNLLYNKILFSGSISSLLCKKNARKSLHNELFKKKKSLQNNKCYADNVWVPHVFFSMVNAPFNIIFKKLPPNKMLLNSKLKDR